MGRNSILMRVENIGDIFNSQGQVVFQQVDLKGLADGLFVIANSDNMSFAATITELSLTGNQPYQTMVDNKIKWTTVDDNVVSRAARAPVDTEDLIELQQQRIRVFSVTYEVTGDSAVAFL